ncbi:MAG: RsmE family RNA methyltransferase [Acidimicrobiales bacterium]
MTAGDPSPDGSHGPHVLVDSVEDPQLSDDDRHHLTRVLRVRDGDALTVGDGAGRWRPCRLGAEPEPTDRVHVVPGPRPAIGVAFALIKGGRPELVVQKLTELGVDVIVPFTAGRSVVRWDDTKAVKNHDRLQRVAREAVMQCRRAWLPTIEPVTTFDAVAARPGTSMADRLGGPVDLATPLVMIGPEGGWDPHESASELPRVGLAEPVLRAETAAIAAGVLLASARSGAA